MKGLRRGTTRPGSALLCAVALGSVFAGCGPAPQLSAGSAVTITSPHEMAVVRPPLLVRWQVASLPRESRFAVFVDALPMHPGASLRSLVPSGDPCLGRRDCPDPSWLRTHGIVVTSSDHVLIATFPTLGGLAGEADPVVHQVVVVPLRPSGTRLGEDAYTVDVRVPASAETPTNSVAP